MPTSRPFTYMQLANVDYIEQLHQEFLSDPDSLEPSWRYFFEGMEFGTYQKFLEVPEEAIADLRVFNLIDAYRTFGHLQAACNPVSLHPPEPVRELLLSTLGFKESELEKEFPTCGLLDQPIAPLKEIISILKEIYCGRMGIEYMDRRSPELERSLQEEVEKTRMRPDFSIDEKRAILDHLNKAELFEIFLHTKYVGQKRFSLEGGETLIPILARIVEKGPDYGMDEFVIGMAHRGRLNVLCNILNKSYSMVFSEFEDYVDPNQIESAGDVKYHKGYSSNVSTPAGKQVHISLTANPSHLESVNPVVEGKVRAKQVQRKDDEKNKVVPILIHGDASLAGQGVVYETMQLHQIEGYSTGGTIHIVINNQIGFTTLPREYRSSRYSTDIANAFGFPVFHVNAEDPEGCVYATELALRIRRKFHVDVLIELNCYRKYGHNESDEPMFTQPLEYQLIKNKKSIRETYRDELIRQGVLERQMALALEEKFKESLHYELEELKISKTPSPPEAFGGVWQHFRKATKDELFAPVATAVDPALLKEIGARFTTIPEGFEIHKKLKKLVETRRQMADGEAPIDWAMGEHLAFASLLWEGTHLRLSGQDSQRGTFTQRHAVWTDQKTGERYFPLSSLKEEQGLFTVYNSPLSEFGVLGFEFGYTLAYPSALVLWEAQFGDFANGGQVIFDQYLASSEQKWLRFSGLVILLPHGYEGQGAEHSSGRLERFLQLSAVSNIQVVYPTTPAQYFHLLRRQVKRTIRIPLIVFTPKGLLRHPECVSSLKELSSNTFQEIIDDPAEPLQAKRLILCSGRIYYDLSEERKKRGKEDEVALIRIEQLYPLQTERLEDFLQKYKSIEEYFWVQEEPRNMGAFGYIYPILQKLLPKTALLQYVGRNRSAVTATGSHTKHLKEHDQLMKMAFE
ncbi:MAG: 2-oxoglutarate dehydrogenase E1 component [Chlamydiales bacterium]|nr:2-oxoglutarate dehydrogenase E1 component [Chlamydiales bacterium]